MNLIYNLTIKYLKYFIFLSYQTLALGIYFRHFNWLWKTNKNLEAGASTLSREKLVRADKVPMDNEKNLQNNVFVVLYFVGLYGGHIFLWCCCSLMQRNSQKSEFHLLFQYNAAKKSQGFNLNFLKVNVCIWLMHTWIYISFAITFQLLWV